MKVQEYFRQVQKAIRRVEWLIESQSVTFEHEPVSENGFIQGRIAFIDGSILDFSETVSLVNDYYRFHYMDAHRRLITRWDSAPHHKELDTFPHHKHTPRGVVISVKMRLGDALLEIERIISENSLN
jgi:hypothetical protein